MNWWRFIYMIFFFKRELRCALFVVWKHCLDCQDDSFPELYLDWHQFLKKNDFVLGIDLSRSQIKNTRWYFVGDTVGVVDDLKLEIMIFELLVSECMVY